MVSFLNMIERLAPGRAAADNTDGTSTFHLDSPLTRESSAEVKLWDKLHLIIQRGCVSELQRWKQEWDTQQISDNPETEETLFRGSLPLNLISSQSFLEKLGKPRFQIRCKEMPGKLLVSPIHLAVVWDRHTILKEFLKWIKECGSETEILDILTTNVEILEKEETSIAKRKSMNARKMFQISKISGSNVCLSQKFVDWESSWEYNVIHLAILYSTECLVIILQFLEASVTSKNRQKIISGRDSKGSEVIHLAAGHPSSDIPVRLLLEAGAQAATKDNYLLAPIHYASRFGQVESAEELLHYNDHAERYPVDLSGRHALHYAHSPEMIQFLLTNGYNASLDVLKYQTRYFGQENIEALLEDSAWTDGDLLILDFSLAMEQDKDGDMKTDGESEFLKNFLLNRDLLHVPVVESLLHLKWSVCRRVILLDLLIYSLFIFCLTGVICWSTFNRDPQTQTKLSATESDIVDLVIKDYKSELERRGWVFFPRSLISSTNVSLQTFNQSFDGAPENDAWKLTSFFSLYYTTVVLSAVFVLREVLELVAGGPRQYFSSVENVFEVFVIFLTILCQIFLRYYSDNVYFYEILQVVTVFFGWIGLTLHLGKLPTVGIYIHLAIKVFKELVLSLLVFSTVLLAFSFSFHLAMRNHHVFDNPFTSFLKVVNMMTGEYNFDYDFTFNSVRSVGGSNGLVQVLLICFILLVTITIANMIIALVIANITKLSEDADQLQIRKTVHLLASLHKVIQTVFKVIPCMRRIFATNLFDHVGRSTVCVRIDKIDLRLAVLTESQRSLRSSDKFYPVYSYDVENRTRLEKTGLSLPERIVAKASKDSSDRYLSNRSRRFAAMSERTSRKNKKLSRINSMS